MHTVGQRKTALIAGEFHLHTGMHWQSNQTRLLPGGGESYEIVMDEIGTFVANNLKNCRTIDRGYIDFDFYHYVNYDRGTLCNRDHIRNCIIYFVKKALGIDAATATWTNDHGITFDFRDYYIIIGQELYHLVLRAQNNHIWNYHHSDCFYVIRSIQAVAKSYQLEYDEIESPDLITEYESHPYAIYQHSPLLHDLNTFKIMQNVIINYMRLQGILLVSTSTSKFVFELQMKINEKGMIIDQQEPVLTHKGITAKYIGWTLRHLTIRSLPRFHSV